ncbi:hypothetical protein JHN46_45920, partial [Streptomyces sp. MBT33]|nr:hypothetical protein [Streptomyces sp. MBT33]
LVEGLGRGLGGAFGVGEPQQLGAPAAVLDGPELAEDRRRHGQIQCRSTKRHAVTAYRYTRTQVAQIAAQYKPRKAEYKAVRAALIAV